MIEPPELVTLLPEDEDEPEEGTIFWDPQTRRVVFNVVTVVALKIAMGIAVRRLAKSLREFGSSYSSGSPS